MILMKNVWIILPQYPGCLYLEVCIRDHLDILTVILDAQTQWKGFAQGKD